MFPSSPLCAGHGRQALRQFGQVFERLKALAHREGERGAQLLVGADSPGDDEAREAGALHGEGALRHQHFHDRVLEGARRWRSFHQAPRGPFNVWFS